jgi:lipoprotein-anchoring transpeptidase ErfK/SrfK
MELYTSVDDETSQEKKHHLTPKSFWWEIFIIFSGVVILLLIFGSQYAIGNSSLTASMKKTGVIEPRESVNISFSEPVDFSAVENKFKISPNTDVRLIWSQDLKNLEIKPASSFTPGKKYQVEITPASSSLVNRILRRSEQLAELSFSVVDLPKVVSIIPVSGNPVVKIDSKIEVAFDRSTRGYDVNFEVIPSCDCEPNYDSQRKIVTLTPKNKLSWATDYVVSVSEAVSGAAENGKKLPEIFRANFKTESEPVVVPDPAPNAIVSNEVIEAKITEGKYIDINLSKQNLSIFENGKNLGTYRVSSGKRGMATPTGTFRVMSKAPRAYSKKYNLYMPYWMQFTGVGHGIHELPEWKSGYKEGANHLGTPVSHGCVRLGVGPAKAVYNWSDKGTPIVIHY